MREILPKVGYLFIDRAVISGTLLWSITEEPVEQRLTKRFGPLQQLSRQGEAESRCDCCGEAVDPEALTWEPGEGYLCAFCLLECVGCGCADEGDCG